MTERRRRSVGSRGRGVGSNPANRFTRLEVETEAVPGRVPTLFLRDDARTVISRNASPDIPFEVSLNPFRGCEHGCAYCFARTFHEFLGFSAGLDFETRIMVKEDAPELLARELGSRRWVPRVLDLSGVTDPYQPVERRLELTRRCLEVLCEVRNPCTVVTKNAMVVRDLDLLGRLAGFEGVMVWLSITTLDHGLAAALEPRTSLPGRRLEAIRRLAAAGVPTGVMVAPVIPGLTDHEVPSIVEAAAAAGAFAACSMPLRLPGVVGELFDTWLAEHRPLRRQRVLARVRDLHGGELDDQRFGRRMTGEGVLALQMADLFHLACRRVGLATRGPSLSTAAFRRPGGDQRRLF